MEITLSTFQLKEIRSCIYQMCLKMPPELGLLAENADSAASITLKYMILGFDSATTWGI